MENKKHIDSILNDIEKAELTRFVDNKTQFEAVKKVLLFGAYFNGTLLPGQAADPSRNFALTLAVQKETGYSNEQLGADLRAATEGIRRVEQGFDVFNFYKTPEKAVKADKNPAR